MAHIAARHGSIGSMVRLASAARPAKPVALPRPAVGVGARTMVVMRGNVGDEAKEASRDVHKSASRGVDDAGDKLSAGLGNLTGGRNEQDKSEGALKDAQKGVTRAAGDAKDAVSDAARDARDSAEGAWDKTKEKASNAAESVKEGARDLGDRVQGKE